VDDGPIETPHSATGEPPAIAAEPAREILSEIAASLSSEHDLDRLLERFLRTIVELTGATAGAARVLSDDGTRLTLVGAVGLPQEVVEREVSVPRDCGVCGDAARADSIEEATDVRACAMRSACGYFGRECTSVVAVPLRHRGRMLGVYNLFLSDDRRLGDETLALLRSIGELLGLALENARLARANMRATLMDERRMMASEVHDSIAQSLWYMKMRMSLIEKAIADHDGAGALKYAGDVTEAVNIAYRSLRELLAQFRSRMDPEGLLHALEATAERYYDKTGIRLQFENKAPELALPVEHELQVFHIVNEALANVGRHAGARHARVVLGRDNGSYEVTIEDDGHGIGEPLSAADIQAPKRDAHYGISIMHERARRIGGDLRVEPREGGGTCVRLRFPARAV
jgi:two-component system, NarL family, nitrate/nitrite sensor histidine kinase NarX